MTVFQKQFDEVCQLLMSVEKPLSLTNPSKLAQPGRIAWLTDYIDYPATPMSLEQDIIALCLSCSNTHKTMATHDSRFQMSIRILLTLFVETVSV